MDKQQDPYLQQVNWTFVAPPDPAEAREEARRRVMRRRLLILLCVMCLAFAVTTWLLVRYDNPLWLSRLTNGPASVVRSQLEALNRGDLQVAYGLFSPNYREQVPFEAFHQLVVTHRNMFQTRELRIGRDDESGSRADLETHLVAEGGKRYVARFTLVRVDGRWWIDDLHWGNEPTQRQKYRA
jgi:uncharacterized protein DUF4864